MMIYTTHDIPQLETEVENLRFSVLNAKNETEYNKISDRIDELEETLDELYSMQENIDGAMAYGGGW